MSSTSGSIDLVIASLEMGVADGSVDKVQVQRLLRLAFEDGQLDDDERAVLRRVFDRIDRERVSPEAWDLIATTRFRYKF
jgi:tellurite resistance protein